MNQRTQSNGYGVKDKAVLSVGRSGASRFVEIADRLCLFDGVDRQTLGHVARDSEWFCLPSGWILFREGDAPDGLYLVVSGKLAVTTLDGSGRQTVLSHILAGETVGEMAVLSGAPRSATVVAVRDTELIRIPTVDFDSLFDRSPSFAHFISKLLVRRLAYTSHRHPALEAPGAVALVPLTQDIALAELTQPLCEALSAMGLRAQVLNSANSPLDLEWYDNVDEANDLVIYQADVEANPWTRLCIRQSDRVLLVVDASGPPPSPDWPTSALLPLDRPRAVELLVLHRGSDSGPPWLENLIAHLGAGFHMHTRLGNNADLARLARQLTGRAVGVVLSGGGARGFAHLGVIQALREAGVPIDMVGGTSMGALIGAGIAAEREALREELREAFVGRNPLTDYTVPIVSIFRGRRTSRLLRQRSWGLQISDCWLPFFCTSSNLSSGEIRVHREGLLWKAVRASLAIPGVLPPVIDRSEVLVDGGVINNLPAEFMIELRRGPVIAVDISRKGGFTANDTDLDDLPLWKMILGKYRGVPNIVGLLMRAGTVSSEAAIRSLSGKVDLLVEPKLEGIGMLEWQAFDRAVEAGYRQTQEQLEREPDLIRRLTSLEASSGT